MPEATIRHPSHAAGRRVEPPPSGRWRSGPAGDGRDAGDSTASTRLVPCLRLRRPVVHALGIGRRAARHPSHQGVGPTVMRPPRGCITCTSSRGATGDWAAHVNVGRPWRRCGPLPIPGRRGGAKRFAVRRPGAERWSGAGLVDVGGPDFRRALHALEEVLGDLDRSSRGVDTVFRRASGQVVVISSPSSLGRSLGRSVHQRPAGTSRLLGWQRVLTECSGPCSPQAEVVVLVVATLPLDRARTRRRGRRRRSGDDLAERRD